MSQQITAEQLAEIREKCLASTSVVVRQVLGGYIVQGKVNWSHDGNMVAVQEDECVAVHACEAVDAVRQYMHDQKFSFTPEADTNQPDLPFETTIGQMVPQDTAFADTVDADKTYPPQEESGLTRAQPDEHNYRPKGGEQ